MLRSNYMGLLGQVVGALVKRPDGLGNPLLDIVMQLINNPQTGGLAGMVAKLQQGGLAEVVNSWVATGRNLPVSGEQLQAALGSDVLGQIAARLGVSTQLAAGSLAALLPQVIDGLTPNGRLPQEGDLSAPEPQMLKQDDAGG